MEKVSIEIFADESVGRKGGLVYIDKDLAKRYVAKNKAKYVTITDDAPAEEKKTRSRKPSEDIKAE